MRFTKDLGKSSAMSRIPLCRIPLWRGSTVVVSVQNGCILDHNLVAIFCRCEVAIPGVAGEDSAHSQRGLMIYTALGVIEAIEPQHNIRVLRIVIAWVSESDSLVRKGRLVAFCHLQERVVLPRRRRMRMRIMGDLGREEYIFGFRGRCR